MPLFLEFKPTKKISSDEIVDQLCKSILQLPSIVHQGADVSILRNNESNVAEVKLTIKGISVIDNESSNMLHSILCERIDDNELPFYVSLLSTTEHSAPGEGLFRHERLRPLRSKNSRLLSKITDLVIPDEFCCKLSGDIMDDPVYDIRSPGAYYDQDFLQYWLRKSEKKLMPHTNAPCNSSFLKQNFELQIRIIQFVDATLKMAEADSREQILRKFKLLDSSDKKTLEQSLRRASMSGNGDDIKLILSLGANVNAQDENPEKRNTALHWAIQENKIDNAVMLLRSGARIDIQNAKGETATTLILQRLSVQDPEIQPLVLNCKLLDLELPGVGVRRQNIQLPHPLNGAALFGQPAHAERATHNANSGSQNLQSRSG